MRINGLSCQWQTRDRLLEFLEECSRGEGMRRLLLYLESLEGPDLWAGTSHSTLNLNTRDVVRASDRVPPFIYIASLNEADVQTLDRYRLEYREVIGIRPTNKWLQREVDGVATAATLILEALQYAESPQRNLA